MTANGKIDFYAEDSVSVHSKGDFNFKADRDVNVEAGRSLNMKSGSTTNIESVANYNVYSGVDINLDVGGFIKLAEDIAQPLATHSVTGETTIMKRVPQHEPWSHHENFDPMAVTLAKTDRTSGGSIVVAEPINIPDTFKNART
jgi:hypothetical protein